MTTAYVPGARVVIRDEEWMVLTAKSARNGDAVEVLGLSELVRDKRAMFLSELDRIQLLRPEDTRLVRDETPGHRLSRLYLESLLKRTPPTDARLTLGHQGAVREAPYQWEPAAKALDRMRPRILIADGVGLGKTIEVGVLLTELMRRGRGRRILVVALKSILAQFQMELWARFTIPLVRLDSVGIQRVQAKIPANQNPFHHFDKVIVSVDTLKKDERYRRYLENCRWDAVVIDECQNVAERGTQRSQRNRLGRLLARKTDALILTSATPHDGKPESLASLMRLLEPTSIANVESYTKEDIGDLFIRRFQKDIQHQAVGAFHERDVDTIIAHATPAEDGALAAIDDATFRTIGRSRKTDALFRTLLLKAYLSSPAACRATVRARREKVSAGLQDPDKAHRRDDYTHDLQVLDGLLEALEPVTADQQSKLHALYAFLESLGWKKGRAGKPVVLFSERIDTLHFLAAQITARFGVALTGTWTPERKDWHRGPVALFHGGQSDQEQYALVQDFSNANGTVRLLLGSDAASEGLNLHHACHHLVHYDIPWSLIRLEQRNGRIDRFGQEHAPVLRYLLTHPSDGEQRADLHILETLVAKEAQAAKNLGEVGWLMDLHDPEAEERRVVQAVETGETPEAMFVHDVEPGGDLPWFQDLLDDDGDETLAEIAPATSLFGDDLDWARAGFEWLEQDGGERVATLLPDMAGIRVRPPRDLVQRYAALPPELRRLHGSEIQMTTDRTRVMRAYAQARDQDEGWPAWELLWPQHPVAEWLNDRVLASFRRHEAPLVEVGRGLRPGEGVYLFQASVSNQASQPVIVRWVPIHRTALGMVSPYEVDLDTLVQQVGLDAPLSNTGRALDPDPFEKTLDMAVRLVQDVLRREISAWKKQVAEVQRPAVRHLRRWKSESLDRIGHQQQAMLTATTPAMRRLQREREHVEAVYQDRVEWITRTLNVSPTPYIRLAAVLVRPG